MWVELGSYLDGNGKLSFVDRLVELELANHQHLIRKSVAFYVPLHRKMNAGPGQPPRTVIGTHVYIATEKSPEAASSKRSGIVNGCRKVRIRIKINMHGSAIHCKHYDFLGDRLKRYIRLLMEIASIDRGKQQTSGTKCNPFCRELKLVRRSCGVMVSRRLHDNLIGYNSTDREGKCWINIAFQLCAVAVLQ